MTSFLINHIPPSPTLLVQNLINLGRLPGCATAAQTVTKLTDTGIQLSIDTADGVASVVGFLGQETDGSPRTVASVLLLLSMRSKVSDRKNSVTNFVLNFLSSQPTEREELLISTAKRGAAPIFSGDVIPSFNNFSNSDDEWLLLAEGLIAVLTRGNLFEDRRAAYESWLRIHQRGSIVDFLHAECKAWTRLRQLNALVGIEDPSNGVRTERLLENLNPTTKEQLAIILRNERLRTETMTFSQVVTILDDISEKNAVKFSWFRNPTSVTFQPVASMKPQGAPVQGQNQPGTNTQRSHPRVATTPTNPSPSLRLPSVNPRMAGQAGHTPRHFISPAESATPRSDKSDRNKSHEVRDGNEKLPVTNTREKSPYNLRPRRPADASQSPKRQPQSDVPTFPICPEGNSAHIGLTYSFRATSDSRQLNIGLDSFSAVTLIHPDVVDSLSVSQSDKAISLSGLGGKVSISGDTGSVLINITKTDGSTQSARITGFISKHVPKGVHVLIGTPTFQRMGLRLDFSGACPMAHIAALKADVQLIPNHPPCSASSVFNTEAIEPLNLPTMDLQVDQEEIPFQTRKSYGVPFKLAQAADLAIQAEIDAGRLCEVEYDESFWISPLFVKNKGKMDPETGLPSVRLLADLTLLNDHLVIPDYWRHYAANISTFADFVEPSPQGHYTLIDIKSAYHTCYITPASRKFVVTRFKNRLLQYQVCPQGLSASALFWPIHLSAGLNKLLGETWQKWARVYVDDILIYGKTYVECAQYTELIVNALKKMDKPISPKSILTPTQEIDCIGITFSPVGIKLSKEGIEKLKIALSTIPKTMKDARRLVGSLQYAHTAFDIRHSPALFGELMHPILALVRNDGSRLKMTDEAKRSIEQFNSLITNEGVIFSNPCYLIDEDHILVITTDASDLGVGSSLFRCECDAETIIKNPRSILESPAAQLVALDHHSVSDVESRWFTFELEALSIYRALSKWQSLLCSAIKREWNTPKIVVLSDSMTTLAGWKKPSKMSSSSAKARRFIGWSLEVSFTKLLPLIFAHVSGEDNCLADILSRIATELRKDNDDEDYTEASVWHANESDDGTPMDDPISTIANKIQFLPLESGDIEEIAEAYADDKNIFAYGLSIADIYAAVCGENIHPTLSTRIRTVIEGRYKLAVHPHEGESPPPLLYTRASYQVSEDEPPLDHFVLVVPVTQKSEPRLATIDPIYEHGVTFREELLVLAHESQGHPGCAKTADFLRRICWWPSILEDVKRHVSSCEFCSARRTATRASGLQVVGSDRFSHIQIDHKSLSDTIQSRCSFTAVLSILDTLTGVVRFVTVRSYTAAETAFALFTEWIRIFGIPKTIQTDNSSSFSNELIQELCTLLGVKKTNITPYNPPANGRIERRHRDINRWLMSCEDLILDDRSLTLYVSLAEMDANHLSNASILMLGMQPRTLPAALVPESETTVHGFDENIVDELRNITVNNAEWQKLLLERKARYNSLMADARNGGPLRTRFCFKEGDTVLFDNKHYRISKLRFGSNPETPTSALLEDPEMADSSPIRVKYEMIRPIPTTTAVPGQRLPSPIPKLGSFVFYQVDNGVFAGKTLSDSGNTLFVHLHSPNRGQSIYHPNWWSPSPDEVDEYRVVRSKAPPSDAARPVVHAVHIDEIVASGEILTSGRISDDLKSQLYSRGVFQVTSSAWT